MIVVNEAYCPKDHRCPAVSFCPQDAIVQDIHSAPRIEDELRTECGACTQICRTFSYAYTLAQVL